MNMPWLSHLLRRHQTDDDLSLGYCRCGDPYPCDARRLITALRECPITAPNARMSELQYLSLNDLADSLNKSFGGA